MVLSVLSFVTSLVRYLFSGRARVEAKRSPNEPPVDRSRGRDLNSGRELDQRVYCYIRS